MKIPYSWLLLWSVHAPFISSHASRRRIASLEIRSLGGLGRFAEAPGRVKLRERKVLSWTPTAIKATSYQDCIHTHFQPLNCQPLDFVVNSFFYNFTCSTEIEISFLKVPTLCWKYIHINIHRILDTTSLFQNLLVFLWMAVVKLYHWTK